MVSLGTKWCRGWCDVDDRDTSTLVWQRRHLMVLLALREA
jgi:hypothetical protein